MITITKVNAVSIADMKERYTQNMTAPIDDMWELGIIVGADHYTLGQETTLGYFVVDARDTLLQFYLDETAACDAQDIFKDVLTQMQISQAYVSTYDPFFLMLCLDNNDGITINSYLYTEAAPTDCSKSMASIRTALAQSTDLNEILAYSKTKVDLSGDWLTGYYANLIHVQGLFLYMIEDEIIGTGEMRPSLRGELYANIGMTVSIDHRRKSIGTYILSQLRRKANDAGLKAVCSTSAENIASQRTIVKSGFIPYHRVLTVQLK